MSLPQRPGKASPRREDTYSSFRESSRRRHRTHESGRYHDSSAESPSGHRHHRHHRSRSSRRRDDVDEERGEVGAESRHKKTLSKPERSRVDKNHPHYHYRQKSQNLPTQPSTTGDEPLMGADGEAETNSSQSMDDKGKGRVYVTEGNINQPLERLPNRRRIKKRRSSRKITRRAAAAERKRQEALEQVRPPSPWTTYCAIITFWAPDFILKCFGMPKKAQRSAWREKIGLISLILLVGAFVGFLTFGFTATVCGTPPTRLRINEVSSNYMIFHGKAYDLSHSTHPAAAGIPAGSNVLWDLPHKYGGQDGSFFFQEVNGACKNLITLADGSDVPTNSAGDLAWYFPCHAFNQDGSSKPNKTVDYYLGWACHTSGTARKAFYNLNSAGDVYFTWDDTKNTSRNLAVYDGDVLDLDLLEWFNASQVNWPSKFDELRENSKVRGVDLTYYLQTGQEKRIGQCLSQIIKVGSIDTDTVGCIASKVVLYVSLIFILSIVVVKFIFALLFQWFISARYAAPRTSMGSDSKTRNQQIEDWANDIYRPGPRMTDYSMVERGTKRASFLPTTSRFSSPYTVSNGGKQKYQYVTMASQNSTTRLVPGATNSMYKQSHNSSGGSIGPDGSRHNGSASRSSLALPGQDSRYSTAMLESEAPGMGGYVHEGVIPQPPPEWQPYGFPLAHSLCLVTCYSEGEEGIRTTLDSIAMTDYPNSHKTILVICDGMIKGKGEEFSTPEIVLGMMKDPIIPKDEVKSFSYVAVATGSKRHNMAKVYAGFYDYGVDSVIPEEKQQRVPMMVIVKSGTPSEANKSKPGNRGKRDSQIILMSFLQKVMFDERMTELEYEMFNGLWQVTGISPDFYEVILMVDADTKVFPDSLTHMIAAMVKDPEVMGLCGETKIANKTDSWVTMIQVFEYFISHHQAKAFESVFGGVTCLPGCFSMYRIKAPKGGQNYWVPILASPDVVEHYSENVVDTLHKKNLLLLGEDRYLSTLMLRTFPKRKQIFVPQAVCKTQVPEKFMVLLSQRRRWINSTVHNLMELVLVRDLCGTFCFSMQFCIFIELIGTLVLPAAIAFTFYVVINSIVHRPVQVIPLVLLALILGLPGVLIVVTAHKFVYVLWMFIYLLSLPVWNFVLPTYSYWKFDDFSWGDTRQTSEGKDKGHEAGEGEFDSSKITMKRWRDFEKDRRLRVQMSGWGQAPGPGGYSTYQDPYGGH
ncbi:chitin synthase F [Aspergillus eucalypticola CBS 122712]|uniref:chitin synthase n=1 Tax=Aspergillus eucalypticola (strain CBS 122712 / IBT 29274) TaxID=1448314 RepID=A0A317UN85_ASPEC|nr:chitin synthase F [Aspergillus eucalypticola CBS 122712]PWY62002.1 chitin synthase F [Aspergillus eucalypticola CBS 122712]